MENNPLVSIIVVNFNGKKYLQKCFDSLYAGVYKNIEIIFVDNGSSDGSSDFVRQNYKDITVVDLKENLGLAIASNKGSLAAKGKYLLFYNNDTIADVNLVSNLLNASLADPEIGVSGCMTYTYDGKSLINAGVPCDIFGYPYGKTMPFYVDASIFLRKDLFFTIGAFDERMFLYGEDRDLCWRCWLYGYKVKVISDAKFFHDSACVTEDIKKYRTNMRKRFLGEFNALRSILKNYSLGFLVFILPTYMFINLAEVIGFLLRGDFAVVKNVYFRSYIENLKYLDELKMLRKRIQKERKVSDFEIIKHMDKVSGKLRLFLNMGLPKFSDECKYSVN